MPSNEKESRGPSSPGGSLGTVPRVLACLEVAGSSWLQIRLCPESREERDVGPRFPPQISPHITNQGPITNEGLFFTFLLQSHYSPAGKFSCIKVEGNLPSGERQSHPEAYGNHARIKYMQLMIHRQSLKLVCAFILNSRRNDFPRLDEGGNERKMQYGWQQRHRWSS